MCAITSDRLCTLKILECICFLMLQCKFTVTSQSLNNLLVIALITNFTVNGVERISSFAPHFI